MSWQEKDRVKLRKEFVLLATQEGINMAELCRRFSVSRKTGYKWLNRYLENGETLLCDQSRRPHNMRCELSKVVVAKAIEVRKKHPCWGARKIRMVLKRKGVKHIPAASSIHRVLQREGYIEKEKQSSSHSHRFEHESPNHLWQMDFKGHFEYEKGRCHPLTILDDHSRFSLLLHACSNERARTVKSLLIEVFRRYGLPERFNVDNGQPWGSLFECARYTSLSLWLIRLGIKVSYSRPYHPQTNGKEERFHRTLKEELLANTYFRSLSHIQRSFDQWRDVYNLERPHEGINMKVPAERYSPSYRKYLEVLPDVHYASDYQVRSVDKRGRLSFENRQLFVGVPFSSEQIGIRHTSKKDVYELYYCHQKLSEIDLKKLPRKSIVNIYSGRISNL